MGVTIESKNSEPTQNVYRIRLPMRIQSSKRKKTALNLNIYRNLHHRSLHAQKVNFGKLAKKLLKDLPPLGKIRLHYDVFPETKRRLDIMNVGSVVDKYFSDCLTDEGIVIDDNNIYLDFVSFGFGGLTSKGNEHVLVTITEIEPRKEDHMRTNTVLDLGDFSEDAAKYLESINVTGLMINDDDGEITLTAVMTTDAKVEEPAAPKKRRGGGRPAGSKNKPKDTTNDVESTSESNADSGDGGTTTTSEEKSEGGTSVNTEASNNAKNLFEDSPEGSSKTENTTKEESGDTTSKSKVGSSIFDD